MFKNRTYEIYESNDKPTLCSTTSKSKIYPNRLFECNNDQDYMLCSAASERLSRFRDWVIPPEHLPECRSELMWYFRLLKDIFFQSLFENPKLF